MSLSPDKLAEVVDEASRVLDLVSVTPFEVVGLSTQPFLHVGCEMEVEQDSEEIQGGMHAALALLEFVEKRFADRQVTGDVQVVRSEEMFYPLAEKEPTQPPTLRVQLSFWIMPPGAKLTEVREYEVQEMVRRMVAEQSQGGTDASS